MARHNPAPVPVSTSIPAAFCRLLTVDDQAQTPTVDLKPDVVIVQAGGRGSRLRHHTWNKPKCLVSVGGRPLLYQIFERFPESRFVVIGDYLFEQLRRYLDINKPKVDYDLVRASGSGTLSGIREAVSLAKPDESVLLAWSDLIIGEPPKISDDGLPIVFFTNAFTCRWSIRHDGLIEQTTSDTRGIPGLFYFPKASDCGDAPESGEFVQWLSSKADRFKASAWHTIEEIGEFDRLESSNDRAGFTRYFNEVEILETTVVKRSREPAFEKLTRFEIEWYRDAAQLGFQRIPKVLSTDPLTLQRIRGCSPSQIENLTQREQRALLANILNSLKELHRSAYRPSSHEEISAVYVEKTRSRVNEIAPLIPGFNRDSFTINGLKCKNLFHQRHSDFFDNLPYRLLPDSFAPIHGDPTFSNTIVDENLQPWFIDPRGYFVNPGMFGDPWYDFAKVYYSAVGGYDAFNRRKFKLRIDDYTVEILAETPSFQKCGESLFSEFFGSEMDRIKILHSLIWMSLSGYAKDDIDSAVAAFFNGLYWAELATSS